MMKPLMITCIGLALSLLMPTTNAELSEQDRNTLNDLAEQISLTRSEKLVGLELAKEGDTLKVNVGEKSYFLPYKEGLPAVVKAIYQSYPCINKTAKETWGHLSLICQYPEGTLGDLLTFPTDYYSYFEKFSDTDTFPGQGDKLAIVVHDPHFALNGQRALFLGLQKLIAQNQLNKDNTVFLMEGINSETTTTENKDELQKLSEKLKNNKNAIYWMFNQHLINAPILVNLIDQLDIPIQGIEDMALYDQNKYDRNHNAILQTALAIQVQKAKRQGKAVDVEETKRFLESLLPDFYSQARRRSEAMATHVSDFIKRDNHQYYFIFIGNFHETEIVAKLKEDNTSYIVIKPLQSSSFGEAEPYDLVETPDKYLERISPNSKMPLFKFNELMELVKNFSNLPQEYIQNIPTQLSPKEAYPLEVSNSLIAWLDSQFDKVFKTNNISPDVVNMFIDIRQEGVVTPSFRVKVCFNIYLFFRKTA